MKNDTKHQDKPFIPCESADYMLSPPLKCGGLIEVINAFTKLASHLCQMLRKLERIRSRMVDDDLLYVLQPVESSKKFVLYMFFAQQMDI